MKKMSFILLLCFILSGISLAQNYNASSKNLIVLEKHNLDVGIPKDWFSIVKQDPHFIASVASTEHPKVNDTCYSLYFFALQKNFSLENLMDYTVKAKAYLTGQRNLFKLGAQEEVGLAGLKARENLYMFTIGKQAYMFAVVGFEKGGMGYVVDYWTPRDNKSKAEFSQFRDWMKNGITFIDPQKDVDDELKAQIQKLDESLFQQNDLAKTNMINRLRVAQEKMIKDLKEKPEKFPSSPVFRLKKQVSLDEYAGKFQEAREGYEKLITMKQDVEDAFGEEAWAMLHVAVQRTSERLGDGEREKEMLVWIKAYMLEPQGPFHSSVEFLMPEVIDHLNKQIKKYQL